MSINWPAIVAEHGDEDVDAAAVLGQHELTGAGIEVHLTGEPSGRVHPPHTVHGDVVRPVVLL
jgi:hypothetical protein